MYSALKRNIFFHMKENRNRDFRTNDTSQANVYEDMLRSNAQSCIFQEQNEVKTFETSKYYRYSLDIL